MYARLPGYQAGAIALAQQHFLCAVSCREQSIPNFENANDNAHVYSMS